MIEQAHTFYAAVELLYKINITLSIVAVDTRQYGIKTWILLIFFFFSDRCHAHKCPYRVNKEPTTLLYTTLRQQLWQIQSPHTISSNFLFLHTTFRLHSTVLQFFSTNCELARWCEYNNVITDQHHKSVPSYLPSITYVFSGSHTMKALHCDATITEGTTSVQKWKMTKQTKGNGALRNVKDDILCALLMQNSLTSVPPHS